MVLAIDAPGALEVIKRDWNSPKKLGAALDAWSKKQHPAMEVALATIAGSGQGAFLGGMMGFLTKSDPASLPAPGTPGADMAKQMAALNAGGPWAQARNFAVMTGVNAGLAAAYRHATGKEDVVGTMVAAFGSGAAFSFVSGMGAAPGAGAGGPLQSAVTTGMAFAVFQGLFHQVGAAWSGGSGDKAADAAAYARGAYMLRTLGLHKYEKAIRKAQLSDATLLLWTEAALADARVPPGPRLLILAHLDQYRGRGGGSGGPPAPPPPPPPVVAPAPLTAETVPKVLRK